MENTIRYKPEVETVTQTGSTNNLATETHIDAISVAIPMFWGTVFSGVYVDFAWHFLTQKFQDGGRIPEVRSYKFATENDTKVISAAAAMFQGTHNPPPPASTLFD